MVQLVMKSQRAFERLEEQDGQFLSDVKEGPSTWNDWDNAYVFVKFLTFFEATKRLSVC